jgi:voltage-gated potassium channel
VITGRQRHPLRQFRLPALLLCLVLVYGTVGYVLLEGWNLLDALYMTVLTITGVGFGEVHPLSPGGRVFTISLVGGGLGIVIYVLGLFIAVLADGELVRYRRWRTMEQRLDGLRGHFIVCGYGRAGSYVVREFDREATPHVVIDRNPHNIARLQDEGRLFVEGDASAEDVLQRAGIARARGLISAIDSDEGAVYITLAARALNPQLFIVARAGQPASIRRLELAGADRVVSPYEMAGREIASLALRPDLVGIMPPRCADGSAMGVEELVVRPGSGALGTTLHGAGLLGPALAHVLAVRRRDGRLFINPDAALALQEGDLVIALGTPDQLSRTAAALE